MPPVTLAIADVVPFTSEQRLVLVLAWILLFLVPALGVRAHAVRKGRAWGKWFVLTLLTGPIGVLEYVEDGAVTRRRAARAERAARRAGEAAAPPSPRDPEGPPPSP